MKLSLSIFASTLFLIANLQGPTSVVSAQASSSHGPVCNGVFDLYFILDSSGSVSNNYRPNIVPFVRRVINRYTMSGFRVAIVTFNSRSTIQLTLTPISNTAVVNDALNRLENVQVTGSTILSPALTKVNAMITNTGGGVTSIILIVTDGGITDQAEAKHQAKIAQNRRSTILAIGVGSYNERQLIDLTGYRDRVFTGTNFDSLNQLLDKVIKEICIEITVPNTTINSTSPLKYCRGQNTSITTSGSGFETLNRPNCFFWTPAGTRYNEQPLVTDNRLVCPTPATGNYSGDLFLQVTTRTNYKENKTKLFIEDCRKLSEVHPNQWCVFESVREVNVSGTALTDGLDLQRVHCNYKLLETGAEYTTYPLHDVTDDQIRCPTNSLNENFTLWGVVKVRISLNGVDYVPNTLSIKIDDCTQKTINIALIAGIAGGLLGLLVLLATCCLLWCLCPLITGTIVGGVVQKEQEPLPVPAPPTAPPPVAATPRLPGRKWSIVDTSYYGIRGVGGIRPAKVHWGNKGTTEEGAKLKRAKDAVKLGEVEVEGPPAPPTSESGMTSLLLEDGGHGGDKKPCCCILCCLLCYQRCCGVLINKIKRCYVVIASYRPVFKYHGTLGKRILCCPGPNIEEKLKTNGTSETPNGRSSSGGSSQRPQFRLPRSNRNDIQEPLLLN